MSSPYSRTKQPAPSSSQTGKVRWFNDAKGFGFVRSDGGDVDCFVHYSAIRDDSGGRRTLLDGQRVRFTVIETERGLAAVDVQVIE